MGTLRSERLAEFKEDAKRKVALFKFLLTQGLFVVFQACQTRQAQYETVYCFQHFGFLSF